MNRLHQIQLPRVVAPHPVLARVGQQYERHPYPHYPLLMPPRWQEGFRASSAWCQMVANSQPLQATSPMILLAGCGDMMPLISRELEPRHHRVVAVDLSRRNLRRARLRLLSRGRGLVRRGTVLVHHELNDFLICSALQGKVSHCDVFGVLHHLPDPAATLAHLSDALAPGGTMRLMVYNQLARRWIRHLQLAFRMLGLNPNRDQDRRAAKHLIHAAAHVLPRLHERLQGLGPVLQHSSRLVDTFFHAWEIQIPPERWLAMIEAAGLEVAGLYDRYAELDDLANPLCNSPTADQLTSWTESGRLEGNLEWILRKPGGRPFTGVSGLQAWRLRPPPLGPFRFEETKSLSLLTRWRLWQHLISRLQGDTESPLPNLPQAAMQRLAREGIIGMGDAVPHAVLHEPMGRAELEPDAAQTTVDVDALESHIEKILRSYCEPNTKGWRQVIARIAAAGR